MCCCGTSGRSSWRPITRPKNGRCACLTTISCSRWRAAPNGEGALFEQRVGDGQVLLCAGGSLFTNRALGNADNARLFANIVSARMAGDGVVLFDDLRQGLSANYDPARFYRDPRLFKTMFIVLGLWFVWVLGSTRLRAPAIACTILPRPSWCVAPAD